MSRAIARIAKSHASQWIAGALAPIALSSAIVLFGACKQPSSATNGAPNASVADESCAPTGDKNADVMNSLSSDCAGCHSKGSNKPFFVSLTSFETTLVYNTDYVVPGKPEDSELIRLLKGTNQGTFAQMPTSGATFAQNDTAGKTKISVSDLEDWIKNLPPQGSASFDYLKAATVRRLNADQVLESLNEPLGLTDADLFGEARVSIGLVDGDVALPARAPDSLNYRDDDAFNDAEVYPRYLALGGASWFDGKAPDTSFSSTYLETLTQMSQARCRKAVEKKGNTAIFAFAQPNAHGRESMPAIKKNIGYLYLRLLGDPPTDADVDDLYQNVFLPYEATDVETGWIAVCAALVRHPLWSTY